MNHICPVCKKHYFDDGFDVCPICGWTFDIVQEKYPDAKKLGNIMSLNEAKKAYAEGKEVY